MRGSEYAIESKHRLTSVYCLVFTEHNVDCGSDLPVDPNWYSEAAFKSKITLRGTKSQLFWNVTLHFFERIFIGPFEPLSEWPKATDNLALRMWLPKLSVFDTRYKTIPHRSKKQNKKKTMTLEGPKSPFQNATFRTSLNDDSSAPLNNTPNDMLFVFVRKRQTISLSARILIGPTSYCAFAWIVAELGRSRSGSTMRTHPYNEYVQGGKDKHINTGLPRPRRQTEKWRAGPCDKHMWWRDESTEYTI